MIFPWKMVDLSIVFVIWIQGTGDSSSLKHGKPPHVQWHKHRQPSWNNIYIHLYPSIYIYIHLYPSISISIYIHLYPSPSISIYIHLYPSISIYIHLYPSISISIYIHLYPSISIYIYIYPSISIYIHLYPSISIYIHLHLYPSISIYIHLCPYHPSSTKTSIPPLLLHQGDAPVLRHRQLPRRQVFQQRRFAHAVGAKEAVVWPADPGGGDHGELRHFIWRKWEAEP